MHRRSTVSCAGRSGWADLIGRGTGGGADRAGCAGICSAEPSEQGTCGKWIAEELKLHPVIDAGLGLGEGTGAVMLFSLLDLALALYEDQTTFDTMEIAQYERYGETE